MKRAFLFTLLVSTVLCLSAVACYAAPPPLDAGCDPAVMTLLQDQADAVRARNRAYEREIIDREQSTLYLTCFDQAMVLSSRLGYIFSDVIPGVDAAHPAPPPANVIAFTAGAGGTVPPGAPPGSGTVLYPDWGAQRTLAGDLNSVISPVLNGELSAPVAAPAMFNFLPPLPNPNALETLNAALAGFINSINIFQTGVDATDPVASESTYIALVSQIDTLVQGLPSALWTDLPADNTLYDTLTAKLTDMIKTIVDRRNAQMGTWLAGIKNAIMTANFNPPCTRLDDMWDNYTQAQAQSAGFFPSEGTLYFPLTPYYTLAEILAVPANQPYAAPANFFTRELQQTTDSAILAQALADLSGPLSQPQAGPPWPAGTVWPAPPQFAPTDVALDIIKQM